MNQLTRWAAATGAGIAIGLVLLEITLRLVTSRDPLPRPRPLADSLHAPSVTRRTVDASVAISHFSVAGSRLTGNPPIDSAPTVVILGDSFVAAREVGDGDTMGAALERIARGQGVPLNVRQYGWVAATPGRYIRAAPDVLTRWNPAHVVIPMANNDLDFNAAELDHPKLRVDSSGTLLVGPDDYMHPTIGPRSVLMMFLLQRWRVFRIRAPSWARPVSYGVQAARASAGRVVPPPDSAEMAALPGSVVGALGKAYGARLVLVYLAEVGVTRGETPSLVESRFLEGCRAHAVTCISMREAMLEARGRGIITRGSTTTVLGYGHLNEPGHALVARAIWNLVRPQR